MLRALLQLDRSASTWIATEFSASWLQWVLVVFTYLGVGGTIWFALAGVGWMLAPRLASRSQTGVRTEAAGRLAASRSEVGRLRAALWRAVMAVLLAMILVEYATKPLARRERPFVHGPAPSSIVWVPSTTSFPSGHAATAAAGAVALSRAWPPATVPLSAIAGLIALSRVALGVHFAGDVLGGLLVGFFAATLASPPKPAAPGDDASARADVAAL
jgi:membrane-associated phospholipid phosphatase